MLISEIVLRNFIVSELDGDRNLFDRLLGHFTGHLSEFNSAKCEQDVLVALAHKIRSGCHSFGAGRLEQKLSDLETLCRGGVLANLIEYFEDAKSLTGPTLQELIEQANDIFEEIKKNA